MDTLVLACILIPAFAAFLVFLAILAAYLESRKGDGK
jgi:hypothetical protein